MARVTLYTDTSKVGETTRAEARAYHLTEIGNRMLKLSTDSAQGLAQFIYNPLDNKPPVFSPIQPDRNLLNTN